MNPNAIKNNSSIQQLKEDPLTLKLKQNFQQNIFYIQPDKYSTEMQQFNYRNSTYGVTIDYRFLKTIQECAYLQSSQLQFYMNLFLKVYTNVKLAASTCYFFGDLIVQPGKQGQILQEPQIIKLDFKRPNIEENNQEQNKIQCPPQSIIIKELPQQQFNQNNLENQELNQKQIQEQGDQNNSISKEPSNPQKVEQQQPQKTQQQQPQKVVNQKNNPQEIAKNSQNQVQQQTQEKKQEQNKKPFENKKQYDQKKTNQQKHVENTLQKKSSKGSSTSKKEFTQNNITQKNNDQNQKKEVQNKKDSQDQQIKNQVAQDKINQTQIPISQSQQVKPANQEPTQQNLVEIQILQQKPFEQAPVKQTQVETQIQPPPEKKFHFQITSIQVEELPPKEIIQKSQLGVLIKQFADINNLMEDQLKDLDYWFFPINQKQIHWISIVVQFNPSKIIYYFDSDFQKIDPLVIQGIDSILEYFNFEPKQFEIKTISNSQKNGYDCGVFLLLSLLYTLRKEKYNYNQIEVTKFRKRILYDLAVIGAQANLNKDFFEYLISQK